MLLNSPSQVGPLSGVKGKPPPMLSVTGELVLQPRKSQEWEGASAEAVKVGRGVRVRRKRRRRRGDMVEEDVSGSLKPALSQIDPFFVRVR